MPFDLTKKPTDDEFDRLSAHYEKVWSGALSEKERADDFYFQKVDIWADVKRRNPGIQINRPEFQSGAFTAKIDQEVNSHLAFEPRLHRVPTGPSADAEKAAGLLEKGSQALQNDCFMRAGNFPTKENGKQIALHNHTGLLTLLDTQSMQRPEKKEGEDTEDFERREWEWESSHQHWNPMKIVVPTAGEVLCDPFESNPPVIIWRRKIRAYDLNALLLKNAEKYQKLGRVFAIWRTAWAGVFSMPADPYQDIEVEEWWTVRWHGMKLKKGGAAYWEPNTTGIQPYSQVWGGNAISPTGKDFDLKYWVDQTIVHKIMDEVIMEAQTLNAHHSLIQRGAWAPLGSKLPADELAEMMRSGRIGNLNPDDIFLVPSPQVPALSFAHKESLEKGIDLHTFSPLTVGLKEMAQETATGVLTRAENTSRVFKPAVVKMGHLHSLAASDRLKLIYRLSKEGGKRFEEVGIGQDKVRVRDMGDPPQFHMIADFEQVDAAVQQLLTAQEVELAEKGFSSWAAVQRVRRVEDPEGLRREIAEDRARNDPMVQEEYLVNALRNLGEHEIADKLGANLKLRRIQRIAAFSPGQPPVVAPGAMQPVVPAQMPANGAGGIP